MDLTLTPQRAAVVEFCRPYIGEEMAILSLKPKSLPEYMALVRPYEASVWAGVVSAVMVWSVTLWLLLRAGESLSRIPSMSLYSSLFYGWGLLLEDQPYEPPASSTGQASA
ncbi:glutamate [NMDA] receptor subunit 1-like [Eriocheir sinensis]|uniref:glutamate [NMDA] receptor subunit 1-like n=1 Tax=Eriocheir sinensis TaxID=95602 RepID=UPI0021C6A942|nr:glutamate [NMDA] receptor subunit 1-like [Eriocheir sinensis]